MSTYASLSAKQTSTSIEDDESQPSFMSLQLHHVQDAAIEAANSLEHEQAQEITEQARDMKKQQQQQQHQQSLNSNELTNSAEEISLETKTNEELQLHAETENLDDEQQQEDTDADADADAVSHLAAVQPEVDEHVKQISHKIEKIVSNEQMYPIQHHPHAHFQHAVTSDNDDDINRQSFLSLTDLIRTLRPNDKQIIPQIDSDYSNAMRVLGENTGPLNHEEAQQQQQHALKY